MLLGVARCDNSLVTSRWETHETERLLLTRMTDADLDSIHEIYSDPMTWLHLPSGRFEDRKKTERMLEGSDRSWRLAGLGQWSVRHRLGMQESSCTARGVVGTGGVTVSTDIDVWNLGYRLTPSRWGRGYATELARTSVRVAARTTQPLRTVTARVLTSNPASQKLLTQIGMDLIWEGPNRELDSDHKILGRQIYSDRAIDPETLDALIALG